MPLSVLFWVIMVVWLVFGWFNRPANGPYPWASTILTFVLFAILGWQVFGPAVK